MILWRAVVLLGQMFVACMVGTVFAAIELLFIFAVIMWVLHIQTYDLEFGPILLYLCGIVTIVNIVFAFFQILQATKRNR